MKLHEMQDFIGKTLCGESAELFGRNIEDMFYRIRSWALSDTKTPVDQMKERVNKMCKTIIIESIKAFLQRNYSRNWSVSSARGEIVDGEMNVIQPIHALKQRQGEMIPVIEEEAMAEFCRGRTMARGIVSRAREMVARRLSSPRSTWDYPATPAVAPRNYEEMPPLERLEIEIAKLERKLPGISPEEAKRLKELYDRSTAPRSKGRGLQERKE